MNNSTRNAIIVASVSLLLFTKCGGLGNIGHKLKHQGTQEKSIAQVTDVKFTEPMEYPSPTMKELEVVFPDETGTVTEAETEPVTEITTEITTEPAAETEAVTESPEVLATRREYFNPDNLKIEVIPGIFDPYDYSYIEVPEEALYGLDVQTLKNLYAHVPSTSEYMMIIIGDEGIFTDNYYFGQDDGIYLIYGKQWEGDRFSLNETYANITLSGDKFVIKRSIKGEVYKECDTLTKELLDDLKTLYKINP